MTAVYDVPATEFINRLAEKLKEKSEIHVPEWAPFVKTGVHRENTPRDRDWWYRRAASISRKVYMNGPIGSERLRALYGGARDRGSKPNRAKKGSGSIAREALQQLEKAGIVTTLKGRGRVITPEGRAFLDQVAYDVQQASLKKE